MKVLVTLAVLAAIVYFLWPGVRRVIRDFTSGGKSAPDRPDGRPAPPRIEADDLAKCAVCGTWVPVGHAVPCERADCPIRAGARTR